MTKRCVTKMGVSGMWGNGASARRWLCVLVVAAAGVCGGSSGVVNAETEDVAMARESLSRWVEARKLISKERADWAMGREILGDRIALVEREITAVREQIADAEKNITDADLAREGLVERNDALRAGSGATLERVVELEGKMRRLIARLPEPAVERVKPLVSRLPVEGEETELSVSDRYLTVVGIVNEVNRFGRDVTILPEVLEVADGSSVEVTAVYLGIGRAYYMGGNGRVAGYGTAGDEGWVWTEANGAAERIGEVIAILRNESVASFVKLPVEIR